MAPPLAGSQRRNHEDPGATLRTATGEVGRAAEVEISLDKPMLGGTTDHQLWLLSESWWADVFRPATFWELMQWIVFVGPWVVASQLNGIDRRVSKGADYGPFWWITRSVGVVIGAVLAIVAAVLAALITPLAIVLLIGSLSPIAFVRDAAIGLQRTLAGGFGDLSVLVRSPIRFAAMSERVRDDIRRMDGTCSRIAVVAHSQGCAVSWDALRQLTDPLPCEKPYSVSLFVTFGQVLRKLKMLYMLQDEGSTGEKVRFFVLASVSTLFLLLAAIAGSASIGDFVGRGGDANQLGAVIGSAGGQLFLLALAGALDCEWFLDAMARSEDRLMESDLECEIETVHRAMPGLRWIDFWASADPAPNGPLLERVPPRMQKYLATYKVRNLGSTLYDHSSYWSNMSEFVSAVAFAISSRLPHAPLAGGNPVPRELRLAALRRDARVDLLVFARVALFGAAGALLFAERHRLPGLGRSVLAVVSHAPGVPASVAGWSASGLVAAGVLLAVTLGIWLLIVWAWESLVSSEAGDLFAGTPTRFLTVPVKAWITLQLAALAGFCLWLIAADGHWLVAIAYLAFVTVAGPTTVLIIGAGGRRLGDPPSASSAAIVPFLPVGRGRFLLSAAPTVAVIIVMGAIFQSAIPWLLGLAWFLAMIGLLAAGWVARTRFQDDWTKAAETAG